jgi:lipopolysaccharide/colanic/teichoic acid biosynthesis glycosyltransferase
MGLMGSVTRRTHPRSEIQFLQLVLVTWLGFFMVVESHNSGGLGSYLLFAVGASLISFFILKVFGYFDPLRLFPRKSDLLSVVVAVPVAALLIDELFRLLFGASLCPFRTTLFWTPLLALFVFGSHYFLSRYMLKRGRKYKIVLELLTEQSDALIESFAARGMAEHLEFLSVHDLRKHLLEGRTQELSLIIISRQAVSQLDADGLLIRAHLAGIPIVDVCKVASALADRILLIDTDLWSYVMEATPQTLLLRAFSGSKIIVEPVIAAIVGLILSPVMLAIAAAIKLTSTGPVLYKQTRTGYLGKTFTLVKFRSMRVDSEEHGPRWATIDDDRMTSVGNFIRRTRLDELPQLLNVMRGEMSLFGPRPERPEIYAKLRNEIPLFAMRLIVRPGITGWAQVCAGYAASVAESQLKLEYDLFYIQHMSPRLDFVITLKTLRVILLGRSHIETASETSADLVRAVAVESN